MTSASRLTSDLVDSRKTKEGGLGYPSCNRALAKLPRNTNDTNGYYDILNIYPWATENEIRVAVRKKFKQYHPDGWGPDDHMFMRIKEIADVLLNPQLKAKYDSTPDDGVFTDSQILAMMEDAGIAPEDALEPLEFLLDFDNLDEEREENFWDFYSMDPRDDDLRIANEWYEHLVYVAPLFKYKRTIKVLLWDDDPEWYNGSAIIAIPRRWKPSRANAFALFTCVIQSKVVG